MSLPTWFKPGAYLSPPQYEYWTFNHSIWKVISIDVEANSWRGFDTYGRREETFPIDEMKGWGEFCLPKQRTNDENKKA